NSISVLVFLSMLISSCNQENNSSDAYGNFEASSVSVSPDVSGKLVYLLLEEGEELKEGQLVAIVDTIPYYLNSQELEAQKSAVFSKLKNLDAQVSTLKEQKSSIMIEVKRAHKLLKDGAVTRQTLDELDGRVRVLDSQINAVRVQKESVYSEINVINQKIIMVHDKIDRCYIENPIYGTVLEKYAEQHEMAIAGKPIYKIADLKKMELRVYVDALQLSKLKLGEEVAVFVDEDKKQNKQLSGTISWIASQAEFTPKIIQTKEERVKLVYAIKIKLENEGLLKIGMPGEVVFSDDPDLE
ncbi:MAG: HlyD family efflux transporter periplasmic adaptor subunit, partial [Bacteroidota bacterium]|nr:HlyD family efflux transporter periplasmic adaptor subunit [Bacteroidota bacterium]